MTLSKIKGINAPPLLPYNNAAHFSKNWNEACQEYRTLIRKVTNRYRSHTISMGPNLLQWSEYDEFILGVADFRELKVEGVQILERATCNVKSKWCYDMNERLTNSVLRACAIYMHSMRYHGITADPEYCTLILCEEVRLIIGHPETYSLPHYMTWGDLHMFDPLKKLFDANFSKIHDSTGTLRWVLHATEKIDYLLAVLMGLHVNLGQDSILLCLWDDLARDLCCDFLHICDKV